jgi:uncharacterized protein (TIGR03492 family)
LDSIKSKGILFLSNGHGEDAINCQILKALRASGADVDVSAMAVVGDGAAYSRSTVPIIGPTSKMPSGDVFYMNPVFLLKDIGAGLIAVTKAAIARCLDGFALLRFGVATGDLVAEAIGHASNRPSIIFLSAHSSYYQGRVDLGLILWQLLCSEKCLAVLTSDALTELSLNRQGLKKAQFVANPVMDSLNSTGKDLQLIPRVRTIALLPSSRLREATNNLVLLLELVKEIATNSTVPVQFWAALVPALMPQLEDIAGAISMATPIGKAHFSSNQTVF